MSRNNPNSKIFSNDKIFGNNVDISNAEKTAKTKIQKQKTKTRD